MDNITFNELPGAVSQLFSKLESIENLLRVNQPQQTEPDKWFNLSELCGYLPDRPTKATVYGWVHLKQIPHHKGAKKLRFLKSEIDEWLKAGKRKTLSELSNEADQYLKKKGGRS